MTTILLVEDSAEQRDRCRLELEAEGYRVLEAEDGREALLLAKVESPDLVLMDLSLPGMDGLEALERMSDLRVRPRAIIYSSYQTCQRNYFSWGAQTYVQKNG